MSVAVRCPACQAQMRVSEDVLGKSIRCRECHHAFTAGGRPGGGKRTLLFVILGVVLAAAVLAGILRLAHVI